MRCFVKKIRIIIKKGLDFQPFFDIIKLPQTERLPERGSLL